jgi:hypothetical protein
VVGAVDWASVTLATAFVLGAVVGTVATIAVMRTLMRYVRR